MLIAQCCEHLCTDRVVLPILLSNLRHKGSLPSKSSATISASSVGVTDIQTPSVVRMADPANEVSTRWFNAKLFPTDCSPVSLIRTHIALQRGLLTHRRYNSNRLRHCVNKARGTKKCKDFLPWTPYKTRKLIHTSRR